MYHQLFERASITSSSTASRAVPLGAGNAALLSYVVVALGGVGATVDLVLQEGNDLENWVDCIGPGTTSGSSKVEFVLLDKAAGGISSQFIRIKATASGVVVVSAGLNIVKL